MCIYIYIYPHALVSDHSVNHMDVHDQTPEKLLFTGHNLQQYQLAFETHQNIKPNTGKNSNATTCTVTSGYRRNSVWTYSTHINQPTCTSQRARAVLISDLNSMAVARPDQLCESDWELDSLSSVGAEIAVMALMEDWAA